MKANYFFSLFISVTISVTISSSDRQYYHGCIQPLRCGQNHVFTNVSYPFWGVNKHKYCGETGFELSCTDRQHLTIEIESESFRVLSVDIENQTITVAAESLFGGGCPKTPDFSRNDRFAFAHSTEKIDLFTCPDDASQLTSPSLTCNTSNGETLTYHTFPSKNNVESEACKKVGEVAVRNEYPQRYKEYSLTLKDALELGFDLHYFTEDKNLCLQCSLSGGICGSPLGSEGFQCLCPDKPHRFSCNGKGGSNYGAIRFTIAAVPIGVVAVLALLAFFLRRMVKSNRMRDSNLEAIVQLKRYNYKQIKKITMSFSHVVGKGGFGTVYEGSLPDGCRVAVKVLKDSKGNGEDFINELASMSRTSHVNIVSLLGFCYERSKRAILYEFLDNGSLDKLISGMDSINTDWRMLYKIALGVARGLEYLHHGCKTRIVHFDIKPQNVLLDKNLHPKVSDFGLSKLCDKKESIVSLLETRGTVGYIAPEVFSRLYGKVSHKSDVYSYGMLVLEMTRARNRNGAESDTSSMYFPDWIYTYLEKGEPKRLMGDEITEEEDGDMAKKMIMVALWCIQSCPSDRPAMDRVVEMMEGSVDALEAPPKPVLHLPTEHVSESQWPSEDSLNTEV